MKKTTFLTKSTGLLLGFVILVIPTVSLAIQARLPVDIDPEGGNQCANITQNLRYGMTDAQTNNQVSMLQDFLYTNGFLRNPGTGFYGILTRKAVVSFQSAHGLGYSGYTGPLTRAKIHEVDCNNKITSVSSPIQIDYSNLPTDIVSLLNKHNIDLNKLRSTDVDSNNKTIFTYDTKDTGYTFNLLKQETDQLGFTHVQLSIAYKSLPVFSNPLLLHFSKSDDRVTANRVVLPEIAISPISKISKAEAILKITKEQPALLGVDPQLGYFEKKETIKAGPSESNGAQQYTEKRTWFLVWKAEKNGAQVILDANTGDIFYSFNGTIVG